MDDQECVDFLQWALPRLSLRWAGFRKVRGQVCKRVQRRMRALDIATLADYRKRLKDDVDEWGVLDDLCHIGISRFYRDRGVFEFLGAVVFPALAHDAADTTSRCIRVWSAGCASGEEPYTITILWRSLLQADFPAVSVTIVATDADATLLGRADQARYRYSSVKHLPPAWREVAFDTEGESLVLKAPYRTGVSLYREDIRKTMPAGPFDMVLCRNLAFTYFDTPLQSDILRGITERLRPHGAFVIGCHERLPEPVLGLTPWSDQHRVYQKTP